MPGLFWEFYDRTIAPSVITALDADLHNGVVPQVQPGATLLDAAEGVGAGVHVRPQRGAACVFWTMDERGVDPSTWHNGAKVLYGGGGKWIAQKFKEVPAAQRKTRPLVLPPECAPPPLEPLPAAAASTSTAAGGGEVAARPVELGE